ncbi:BrnT family toxin [Longibacter sp.]|uniref:BrnT family toxin n=1 Tax=Longibacter sp. TaxID=2045415 RepID=UPI003EB8C5A6
MDATRIPLGEHLSYPVSRPDMEEERFVAVGPLQPSSVRPYHWSGPLAVVVYTIRQGAYRIISARQANTNERKRYYARFPRGS